MSRSTLTLCLVGQVDDAIETELAKKLLNENGTWKNSPPTKENWWVAWASDIFNNISIGRKSTSSNEEDIEWFHSTGKPVKGMSRNVREMDFGMRCKSVYDQTTALASNNEEGGIKWRDIEVLGEYTEGIPLIQKWY